MVFGQTENGVGGAILEGESAPSKDGPLVYLIEEPI